MVHQPEFITVPEPPRPTTGLRRCGSFTRVAAIGAVSAFAMVAISSSDTALRFSPPPDCFPRLTPEQVEAHVRAIRELIALEASIRARLLKAQPGVIVPSQEEDYR